MKHYEYDWDLYPDCIVLDKELNTERLGWKPGQFWKMENQDGNLVLQQVDPILQFIIEGKDNPNE
jgi:hypothetical protein